MKSFSIRPVALVSALVVCVSCHSIGADAAAEAGDPLTTDDVQAYYHLPCTVKRQATGPGDKAMFPVSEYSFRSTGPEPLRQLVTLVVMRFDSPATARKVVEFSRERILKGGDKIEDVPQVGDLAIQTKSGVLSIAKGSCELILTAVALTEQGDQDKGRAVAALALAEKILPRVK